MSPTMSHCVSHCDVPSWASDYSLENGHTSLAPWLSNFSLLTIKSCLQVKSSVNVQNTILMSRGALVHEGQTCCPASLPTLPWTSPGGSRQCPRTPGRHLRIPCHPVSRALLSDSRSQNQAYPRYENFMSKPTDKYQGFTFSKLSDLLCSGC